MKDLILEIEKEYTQKELAEALGIKENTFKRNKEKYLDKLDQLYEYKVKKVGRTNIYTIIS